MRTPAELESGLAAARSLEDLAIILDHLLSGGFSVWEDGSLYCIRQLVAKVEGLRIEIRPKEHAPPHFHVVTREGMNASFAIETGALLRGSLGGRELSLVQWWYARSRGTLIEVWNATRPSDCPVGPIAA